MKFTPFSLFFLSRTISSGVLGNLGLQTPFRLVVAQGSQDTSLVQVAEVFANMGWLVSEPKGSASCTIHV